MRKKPELLATAGSMEEVQRLITAGVDALQVGSNHYGLRLPGEIDLEQLQEVVTYAHARNVKVYVVVNRIFDNSQLEGLAQYLRQLHHLKVDALAFGDPAVVMILKELGIQLPLHWNTEMTSTNYATANYWGTKGAVRAVLARELNLEEIHEVKRNTKLEVQVQVHGLTNIYHSKRRLVQSYMQHLGRDTQKEIYGADRGLYLIERERLELKQPIYEDVNGTHIMSPDDLCMIENLDELLEIDLDSLKIEGLMKSIEYNETSVRAYRSALDALYADPEGYQFNSEWLKSIEQLQDKDRELSYGFFFKEQVY